MSDQTGCEDARPKVAPKDDTARLVIVTGLSGAGRSRALSALEDFGYFCVDNLPPAMIEQIASLSLLPDSTMNKIAVACDVRGGELFDDVMAEINSEDLAVYQPLILFLEASDFALINRFKETRRPHPLEAQTSSLSAAIAREREILVPLKARADVIIDTSELRASELRARIQTEFLGTPAADDLSVSVSSFGFKYGRPVDADIIFDVRFLPNPFYDPSLKALSGLDAPVSEYVLSREETQAFMDRWLPLLEEVLPRYLSEGKLHLSIALGCTGGRHRSVALAEATAAFLHNLGYRTAVSHRDINRDTNH